MLTKDDYSPLRDLARELCACMETLCSGCQDSDHRTVVSEPLVRMHAELVISKIGAMTFTKGTHHGRQQV